MNFNQTQFEKRVQRAQKSISSIAKGLGCDDVTTDMIVKVRAFLTAQVADLTRDLEILERSGVKRGVFSLNAPADPSPGPIEQVQFTMPSVLPSLLPTGPVGSLSSPVAVTKLPLVKADQVVGKMAPPDVAKEVLKTAEDAPDRVRVFGGKNAPIPSAGEGDVDFQEE